VDPALTGRQSERLEVGRVRRVDPLSIVLIVVIVAALVGAGVLVTEIYGRSRAERVVTAAAECVVQDGASAAFGARPILLQHMTDHYDNISITTAGNQIREAKGMKAYVTIDDVRLQRTATSRGTIGALNATITWSSDGIKQTVQNSIPLISSLVSRVKTHPSDGTIELHGLLGNITVKPMVGSNGVDLQVVGLEGLGISLPRESVQPAFTVFANNLNDYPLGMRAESVQVTDNGVVGHFSARNAAIPQDDPCFTNL
jgi:hypothetical protein